MKTLFVDDDAAILDMYIDQAAEAGITIEVAGDTEGAIGVIAGAIYTGRPLRLVCDGNIPERMGRLPSPEQGLRVLTFAMLGGVKERWIASSDPDCVSRALGSGAANRSAEKHKVVGMIAEAESGERRAEKGGG